MPFLACWSSQFELGHEHGMETGPLDMFRRLHVFLDVWNCFKVGLKFDQVRICLQIAGLIGCVALEDFVKHEIHVGHLEIMKSYKILSLTALQ